METGDKSMVKNYWKLGKLVTAAALQQADRSFLYSEIVPALRPAVDG